MAFDFDLFVIGAGSGGVRASRLAANAGARVACAEAWRPGGTCVIRGCIPKKYMVYASEYGRSIENMRGFGWSIEGARYDHAAFVDRMQAEIDRLSGIYEKNLKGAGVELFYERAQIAGPNAVRLTGQGRVVTAARILIAVGGRPIRPDIPGAEHAITSDDVFQDRRLPDRIAVVGGGYIAAEMAGVFSGLGVATSLVHRGPLILRGFDDDVRREVQEELIRKGVDVITGETTTAISRDGDDLAVALASGRRLSVSSCLMAIGRRPFTEGLGLETVGIRCDGAGAVPVDAYSRTSAEGVFAIGDVTNRLNLTPVAIREAQAFVETEFLGRPTAFDHADVPHAVFSQPPASVVGLSEAEARTAFGDIDIYRTRFRPMKDMLSGAGERTLMKLVVRAADQRVVGVHIVGADAPEIIQAAAIAVRMGASKMDFDRTCALHPTAAEELVTLREKWSPPSAAG
jgi:glutathione reductase (NADPH)